MFSINILSIVGKNYTILYYTYNYRSCIYKENTDTLMINHVKTTELIEEVLCLFVTETVVNGPRLLSF